MIKEAVGTGNTIDEAKEAALKNLNAPEEIEDVKIEVLEMPKKKTLGLFGGSLAKVKAYYEYDEDKFAKVKDYITVILENLGIDKSEITVNTEDKDVRIDISCGDDYGSVIGRRGETLDAIQYLVRLVINREFDEYSHVSLNVGNYREKREATLKSLAKNVFVSIAPIECDYSRPIPESPYKANVDTVDDIKGWGRIAQGNMQIFDYCTAFKHYPQAFPNVKSLKGNLLFYHTNNVRYVINEGAHSGVNGASFAELKAWL
ncbi:MAG: DUF4838 domain-containing protein, partial [Clostridia bacterium]|nr:DUF4838 domain-containing protein [Clostridia bacterium]